MRHATGMKQGQDMRSCAHTHLLLYNYSGEHITSYRELKHTSAERNFWNYFQYIYCGTRLLPRSTELVKTSIKHRDLTICSIYSQ